MTAPRESTDELDAGCSDNLGRELSIHKQDLAVGPGKQAGCKTEARRSG
jgi:hypothetical protein